MKVARWLLLLLPFATVARAAGAALPPPPREGQFADEMAEIGAILDYHHHVAALDGRDYGLPQRDFEDATNLTLRQRRWFRKEYPGTPEAGICQYPRWAFELMHHLLPPVAATAAAGPAAPSFFAPPPLPFGVTVGANVNVSNNAQVQSETYMAVDPANQRYVVGSSNNITGNPQMMFYSSDWGATWGTVLLPLVCTFHSDPTAAFDSAGNAYSATLEYSTGCGNTTKVNVYQSTTHGATWSAGTTISNTRGNDKELMAVDYQPASPCKDRLYVAWDDSNNEKVATAATWNGTWTTYASNLDTASIGTDIAVGPAGEVYDVWANTSAKQINFSKSVNCGTSWSAKKTIAATFDGYDYGIIAECVRRALIYPSIDVDRTNGPYRGRVYVAWNDFTAAQNSGCVAVTDANTSNIYFSYSADGGTTWSPKKIVHQDLPFTDQFNQWMRVDDADGCIHVAWQDTRNDPNRAKSDVYYTKSCDGGASFDPETRVTSAPTDETSGANGNQYGDYAGLAVRNGVIYPFWTDRRPAWGTTEQVATAKLCSDPKNLGATVAADANACALTGVTVSWSAPTVFWGDGGSGARKYQLFVDGVLAQDNLLPTATSTTYSPGNSNPHAYAVKAVNGCGNVAAYATASVTDAVDTTPPAYITGFQVAKSGGNAAFSAIYTPPADFNRYNLYAAPSVPPTPSWTAIPFAPDPLASPYRFYTLTAVDNCGNESPK